MYRYSAFSLTIDSELELPEFVEGKGEPDVVIRLGSVARPRQPATIENEVALPDHIGRFEIKGGREIVVDLLPDADPFVLRTMLQGRLMACLLRQRGCLPLHASGVAIEGQGVLFVGESGAGKSTTAAAFYSRGHSVLTDDVGALYVAGVSVGLLTAWSGLRLLDDARKLIQRRPARADFQSDKHVFRLERPESAASFPVKRIYLLEYSTGDQLSVRSEVLRGSSAAAALNSHSFLRSWRAGNELLRINLRRCASVAAVMPVHRLIRQRSLAVLPALVDFVEKDVMANE
jgi:hypothetical protein